MLRVAQHMGMSNSSIPPLIFSRDVTRAAGADLRLRRLAELGRLERVARGAFVDATEWQGLDDAARYRLKVSAVAQRSSGVVSHESAAALHGLPLLGRWPDDVHVTIDAARGGRSSPGVRRHATGIDDQDVTLIDGIPVTTAARTALDVAATASFAQGVVMMDRVLHVPKRRRVAPLARHEDVIEAWERHVPFRGSVRALSVLRFSRTGAASPGESISRVTMALIGVAEPELQRTFIVDGAEYDPDFFWEEENAIGESDGRGKYFDPIMRGSLEPQQVVWAEKQREDALRREVRAFARWDWLVGSDVRRLAHRLAAAGVLPRPGGAGSWHRGR